MSRLVPLTFALPLLGVALSLIAVRHRRVQRIINIACLSASLAVSVVLLVAVERDDHAVVARIGGWTSDIGITYVFDRLSGLLLVIALTTMLIVLVFAVGQGAGDEASPSYHPAYLALAAGIAAAFSSGDLFHLFVAFEVLLMASYVLLTLHGEEGQVRSGTTYVIINSVESLLLLSAVGLVYAATGTLSLADLPAALAELDPGCSSCCCWPSGSRRPSSRSSSGCPTRTRPRPARCRRCSPGCSPRSASTPSSAPRRCSSPTSTGCCSSWWPP